METSQGLLSKRANIVLYKPIGGTYGIGEATRSQRILFRPLNYKIRNKGRE
jgi:hypothetical protein